MKIFISLLFVWCMGFSSTSVSSCNEKDIRLNNAMAMLVFINDERNKFGDALTVIIPMLSEPQIKELSKKIDPNLLTEFKGN